MKVKKNNIFKIVTLLVVLLFVIAGCRAAERPEAPQTPQTPQVQDGNIPSDEGQTNDGEIERQIQNGEAVDSEELALRNEQIADIIVDIQGIEDATAVIVGNTALVAVDVLEGTEGVIEEDMRNIIVNTVMRIDEEIENVRLTADYDLFNRIDSIEYSILRGNNINDYRRELESIINRIE